MEDVVFKKDKTPYIVFACIKCKQYMYVKTIQKTKKCLRCGSHHQVVNIINSGEPVEGMTNAVNMVKHKQAEFAIRESGDIPEFRAEGDFKSSKRVKFRLAHKNEKLDKTEDYSAEFKRIISQLSRMYKEFPYYVIEIMAEDYNIPNSELKILFHKSLREKTLNQTGNNLYKLS